MIPSSRLSVDDERLHVLWEDGERVRPPDQPLALFLDDLQWLEGAKLGTRASAIVGNSLNAQPRRVDGSRRLIEWPSAMREAGSGELPATMKSARSVAEIMIIESRAIASYWRTFRDTVVTRIDADAL
jgi:hypothetical protein